MHISLRTFWPHSTSVSRKTISSIHNSFAWHYVLAPISEDIRSTITNNTGKAYQLWRVYNSNNKWNSLTKTDELFSVKSILWLISYLNDIFATELFVYYCEWHLCGSFPAFSAVRNSSFLSLDHFTIVVRILFIDGFTVRREAMAWLGGTPSSASCPVSLSPRHYQPAFCTTDYQNSFTSPLNYSISIKTTVKVCCFVKLIDFSPIFPCLLPNVSEFCCLY